jgi:LuxR family maltose regulon positive regulatory protein
VAQGDLDGALDLLDEAERHYVRDFHPNVRPIEAMKTRVWVVQGRLGEALSWAREQGLSVEDDLSYLREYEHVTLARVLLARHTRDGTGHSIQEAMGLLERLGTAAQAAERTGSLIEILLLQALARQTGGDSAAALAALEPALALAEPQGYVRIFVAEGATMATLLQGAAQHGIAPAYVRQLLAALSTQRVSGGHPAAGITPVSQALREPLSLRELDVLRLLRTELTGPEIGRELMVSLPTMRTHTSNIYSKLGVNNRRAAVRRAEELGLL